MYRTTKTASVRINLGVITFSSIPQKDPSNLSICDRVNCLARYEFLPPRQIFITIGLSPSLSPLQTRLLKTPALSTPLWTRPLKIDETPVDIVEIFI